MYVKIRLHQDDNSSSTNHHLINQSRIHDEIAPPLENFTNYLPKKEIILFPPQWGGNIISSVEILIWVGEKLITFIEWNVHLSDEVSV